MKNKRNLWISLLSVVAVAVIALSATLAAGWSPKLGLDLDGGLSVVYKTHTPVTTDQLNTIVTILGNRVAGYGSSGASVASQGKNEVDVSIPGARNINQILNNLGNTAQLFFRPAECYAEDLTLAKGAKASTGSLPTTCASSSQLTQANLGIKPDSSATNGYDGPNNVPPDPQFTTFRNTSPDNDNKKHTVLLPGSAQAGCDPRCVLAPAGLTGTSIKSASAQLNSGQWTVELNLSGAGLTQWNTMAQAQFHAIIALDLDGQVISAPITQPTQSSFQDFTGAIQISGGFTENQAKLLATELSFGSLPVKLDRINVQTVSPTLGKSSLQAGLISGLAGLALVMLYMIFYYRLLGIVVVAGLAVTSALLWAIISALGQGGTTIDLAGIIGLIVSVGITVDSYIVYFERLKDEARSGRTIRTSVDRGFKSAFRTVLAADAVSLLGAVILYYVSVGDVKGFALFLGISTVLDIFVTYFFTRPFVILLGRSRGGNDASTMSMASGLGVTTTTSTPARAASRAPS